MSKLLDWLSEFLAHRKGLLPLIGILFILINLVVQFVWYGSEPANTNLFLHIGVIVAIIGLMLAWVL
jgi:hypothetical protein